MYHGSNEVESSSRAGPVREDELVRYDGVEYGFEEDVSVCTSAALVDDLVDVSFPAISVFGEVFRGPTVVAFFNIFFVERIVGCFAVVDVFDGVTVVAVSKIDGCGGVVGVGKTVIGPSEQFRRGAVFKSVTTHFAKERNTIVINGNFPCRGLVTKYYD